MNILQYEYVHRELARTEQTGPEVTGTEMAEKEHLITLQGAISSTGALGTTHAEWSDLKAGEI